MSSVDTSTMPPHQAADPFGAGVVRPPADGGITHPVTGPTGTPSDRVPCTPGPLGGRPGPVPPPPLTPDSTPLPPNPDDVVRGGG